MTEAQAPLKVYYRNLREEMHPFVPAQAKTFLEIGCGTGQFMAGLRNRQPLHAVGVECMPEAAQEARKVFDELIEAPVELALQQLTGAKTFDCIIANDVVEHLVDPWVVLRQLKDLLNPGGKMVLSIPNIRHWPTLNALFMQGDWVYRESGVLDRTHLRFFTRNSLPALFDSCGLRLQRLEGINPTPLPWKINWINRLTRGKFDDTRFMQFACVAVAQ